MNYIETDNLFFSRIKHTTPNIREEPENKIKKNKEDWDYPMPTYCLNDKKYCAKEYAGLMMISNKNEHETHRYLYANKINTKELSEELGIGQRTLQRNISKLTNLNYNVLEVKDTSVGVVYKFNHGEKSKNGGFNKYITIHHKMLKNLACAYSSNAIKIYCLLKYMTKEDCFKPMTNKWLAEQIGLSSDSKNNLNTITEIITVLELGGYIETKKENIIRWDDKKRKKIPQITKSYRLRTYGEWDIIQKKVRNK